MSTSNLPLFCSCGYFIAIDLVNDKMVGVCRRCERSVTYDNVSGEIPHISSFNISGKYLLKRPSDVCNYPCNPKIAKDCPTKKCDNKLLTYERSNDLRQKIFYCEKCNKSFTDQL